MYTPVGYAATSYPLKGLGGSTQLECLPYEPTWLSNKASTPLNRTLLTAAKYTLGEPSTADADHSQNVLRFFSVTDIHSSCCIYGVGSYANFRCYQLAFNSVFQ